MDFIFNDGGRSNYFKGTGGDCVARSIAIAANLDYKEVYDRLAEGNKNHSKAVKSALNGINVKRKWFKDYMKELGFEWVPTMKIGQGCKVHLHKDELPTGRLVVSVSKHYTAMVDGVIYDTHDPRRGSAIGYKDGVKYVKKETRCVYGYWLYLANSH